MSWLIALVVAFAPATIAGRAASAWDAEMSNTDRRDESRRSSTPRLELLKSAWFKKGSGTVAGTARKVLRTTVPDPFLNHALKSYLKLNQGERVSMSAELDAILAALTGSEPSTRAEAAEKLAGLGPDARAAAVGLVRACADDSEEVCQWVTAALEELGPPPAADTAAISELLADGNSDVAYWAATLLGRLGPDAAGAVPALADAVTNHPAMPARQRAAWALGKIGPAAAGAVEPLKKVAVGDDPRLARLAQQAIEAIGG